MLPNVLAMGSYHPVQVLNSLDAHLESANSFYENVASHLWECVAKRHPEHWDRLTGVAAESPSLEGLCRFAAETGIDRLYGLDPASGSNSTALSEMDLPRDVASVLTRFMRTVERKMNASDMFGVRSLEYEFGSAHVLEAFAGGLCDLRLSGKVQKVIVEAPDRPLPFLRLNRLFHLLIDQDAHYKIRELTDWEGGLATTFLDLPRLGRDLRALRNGYRERLQRRKEEKGVRTLVVPQIPRAHVEAAYAMPRLPGETPTIVLLDLPKARPLEDSALLKKRMEANELHEFVHIAQEEEQPGWVKNHPIESEIEAHAVDTMDLLEAGERRFYDRICSLSPYGFLMGLRHFVEKAYPITLTCSSESA